MIRYIEQDKIKLPYSIAAVFKQQQRLAEDVPLKKFIGRSLTMPLLQGMAEYLHCKLGKEGIPLSFYMDTLDSFRNKTADPNKIAALLRRIAAITELPERPLTPAVPWVYQLQDEWVPVEVREVTKKPGNDPIWIFRCLALGGRMTDITFEHDISLKRAFSIARISGFNQRSETKRLYDPRQFVGLRLLFRVCKGSALGAVRVGECRENSSLSAYNRKVNKLRDPELRVCRYRMRVPCFRCGVGTDRCPVAVQKETENEQLIFNIGVNQDNGSY
jgi:hypothetical protein